MSGQDIILVLISPCIFNIYAKWTSFQNPSHFPTSPVYIEKRHSSSAIIILYYQGQQRITTSAFLSSKDLNPSLLSTQGSHTSCCFRKEATEGLPGYLCEKPTHPGQSKPKPLMFVVITQETTMLIYL